MILTRLLTATALVASMTSSVVMADNSTLSEAQKTEMQKVIHDYLVNNPEVLLEASAVLQQKQQQGMQDQAKSAISESASQLFNDTFTVLGNPKGNVTLVEFFDYQCIHCKKMSPVIKELISKNANLRVIYKEFPIFGESSTLASKAALAAAMQHKYLAMHEALLAKEKHLDASIIDETAKSIGLNMTKFKADMNSDAVAKALAENRQIAEKMHLMGTPAFIIASTPNGEFNKNSTPAFIPGAASAEVLEELIKKASA